MKLTLTIVSALAALGTSSFAGPATYSISKESKAVVEEVERCFGDNEFQLDIFGQYSDGNAPYHAGIFRDHGWGGGVGINYFFHRNIGLGIDAAWLYAREAPYEGAGQHTTLHNFSGSVIFRAPIDDACIAPYVYVGGGTHIDGEQWASAHAGAGIEFRIQPQKFGIFLDGRWTYLGDRFGRGDINFSSARVGLRFIF